MNLCYWLFLAQNRSTLATFKWVLSDPHLSAWQGLDAHAFDHAFQQLRRLLRPDPWLARFFEIHLLAEYLRSGASAPQWFRALLQNEIDIGAYMDDWDWEALARFRWDAVPAWLTHFDRARRIWFVIGAAQDLNPTRLWPLWADALLDGSARQAIGDAVKAACISRGQRFFCFPLTLAAPERPISGASLGLPLALGFQRLAQGAPRAGAIAASGKVTPDGRVTPVSALDRKIALAHKRGYAAFLYPSDNRPPQPLKGISLLPTAHLSEARLFDALFAPGAARKLMLLAEMRSDAELFSANWMTLEPDWLDWALGQGELQLVAQKCLADPSLFKKIVEQLHAMADGLDATRARWGARLFTWSEIQQAAHLEPLSVHRWCQINLTLANHAGEVGAAQKWTQRAQRQLDRCELAVLETHADFCNHRFMTRHNHYRFETQLPDDLAWVMQKLEKRWRDDCAFKPCIYPVLGRLYGAAAQNYGFCGPAYLDEVLRYTHGAQKAFGQGAVAEHRHDSRRQLNYRLYAFLDAGQTERAEAALKAYLAVADWRAHDHGFSALTPWEHAAWMRFTADHPYSAAGWHYPAWAREAAEAITTIRHPWQLWCFNLGRWAEKKDDLETAVKLYQNSLHLCLDAQQGPTIRVMALLPLAALSALKAEPPKLEGAEVVRKIKTAARRLNPVYFDALLNQAIEPVLIAIRRRPQAWFPFTYR